MSISLDGNDGGYVFLQNTIPDADVRYGCCVKMSLDYPVCSIVCWFGLLGFTEHLLPVGLDFTKLYLDQRSSWIFSLSINYLLI